MTKRLILIVDDSEVERVVLAGFLSSDFEIVEAKNGSEAISILSRRYKLISAIVLDVIMPGMNGYETMKRIRQTAIFLPIPIIVTTVLDDTKTYERAIECGANGFITKPYNRSLLVHTIRNAIRLRETAVIANIMWNDKLTGVLNRESFFIEADRVLGRSMPGEYILSCIDIEAFKVINDQYGVSKGDAVLCHIASCLKLFCAANNGTVCRFTADKFAVLYPAHLNDSNELINLHQETLNPPCIGRPIRIRVGRYLVDDLSLSVSAMYDRATMAEESIKGRYDTYIAYYNDSMRGNLLHEQQIVSDMNAALLCGEFEPWFQPQYNHQTGAMVGAEALVRWRKDGQIIPPNEFIPIFERNGFIYEMDQYLWRKVCELLRQWLDDERVTVLPISVNISRYDILQRNFVNTICGIVREYNVPFDLLRLEITESAFCETSGVIIDVVNQLIEHGFAIEIDDFGSGYSSLNTLKDVPASILKLDMRFLEDSSSTNRGWNILESVVRMARWLGMSVVIEGVETLEQADYMKSIGCDYVQGYLYAKPMPLDEFALLNEKSRIDTKMHSLKTVETWDNNAFWDPKSMETLIFNSYVGGACIIEYQNNRIELLRYSDSYSQIIIDRSLPSLYSTHNDLMVLASDETRKSWSDAIRLAIETKKESISEWCVSNEHGDPVYLHITIRLIAQAGTRYLFYGVLTDLTDQHIAKQKQREAELRELRSAQQLQVIMRNIDGGVSAILIEDDGTSKFVFNNDKYYELFGYSREQAIAEQLDVMSLIIPEDLPGVMAKIRQLKKDRIPITIDYRCRMRNGDLVYLRANASLMHLSNYGDNVITSIVTDITNYRELNDRFKVITENINGGVTASIVKNHQLEYLFVTDKFYEIMGYSKEEYDAEFPDKYSRIHPDDVERVKKTFESAFREKSLKYTIDYRIIWPDGSVRYLQSNISTTTLFGVSESVQLAVTNDVTVLHRAEQSLLDMSALLKIVLSQVNQGICAFEFHDDGVKLLFGNDQYFELIGISGDKFCPKGVDDLLSTVHPDDRETVLRASRKSRKTGKNVKIEFRALHINGTHQCVRAVVITAMLSLVSAPVQVMVFEKVKKRK